MPGARVDELLAKVAHDLELTIIATPGGGEFGAAFVRDSNGRDLVLKAMPGPEWAPRFARGAALSARVRNADYPVPEYIGTGVAAGGSWSLQERLTGEVPAAMTEDHARQLLGFLSHHVSAADRPGEVRSRFAQELGNSVDRIVQHEATASIGRELDRALTAAPSIVTRSGDVVHGDYHHRNFLATGDRVTGVFDWELAWAGDWRVDLVRLACWSSWVPSQVTPEARTAICEAAFDACEPPVLSLFAAFQMASALDFDVRVHTHRVKLLLDVIDATTRAWLYRA